MRWGSRAPGPPGPMNWPIGVQALSASPSARAAIGRSGSTSLTSGHASSLRSPAARPRYAVCRPCCDRRRARTSVSACPPAPSSSAARPPGVDPVARRSPRRRRARRARRLGRAFHESERQAGERQRPRAVPARGAHPRRGVRGPLRGALRSGGPVPVQPPERGAFRGRSRRTGHRQRRRPSWSTTPRSASGPRASGGCSAPSATTTSRCSTAGSPAGSSEGRALEIGHVRAEPAAFTVERAPGALGRQGVRRGRAARRARCRAGLRRPSAGVHRRGGAPQARRAHPGQQLGPGRAPRRPRTPHVPRAGAAPRHPATRARRPAHRDLLRRAASRRHRPPSPSPCSASARSRSTTARSTSGRPTRRPSSSRSRAEQRRQLVAVVTGSAHTKCSQ